MSPFFKTVAADLDACRAQLRECERAFGRTDFGRNSSGSDEFDEEQESLGYRLTQCHFSMLMLIEDVGLPLFHAQYLANWSPFAEKLDKVGHNRNDPDYLYSEPLIYLDQVFESLQAKAGADPALDAVSVLERILRQTPYILKDRGIEPTSEKELALPVYDLVKTVFPDAKREVPIAQVSKTYKADLGVPSLKTCVEFKFAASEQELKSEIDGVFADMRGYAGVGDWVRFFAVFYTAGPVMSPERLEAMHKHVGADLNWTPIIVHGPGSRRVRTRAAPVTTPKRAKIILPPLVSGKKGR